MEEIGLTLFIVNGIILLYFRYFEYRRKDILNIFVESYKK